MVWLAIRARSISAYWGAACIVLVALATHAGAQATPSSEEEIHKLLAFVEYSECQFVRNGKEFRGPEARAHLEKKLDYLEEKHLIGSAEDFIDLAATKSNASGLPYEVRCADGSHRANVWLREALERLRQAH
ncbi:DUF5329 family protein [Pseudomonas japonica]|uniref:DUF5329 family protein n=1 Tax=Pseudomonas japonica TaxID=256466 RepID=UPI0015E29A43|nr:DUF5329 family protein [Pseudomonas japonica]MBA1243751.1 DUF5329 domain-containing protein [Pseudomonas japonica]